MASKQQRPPRDIKKNPTDEDLKGIVKVPSFLELYGNKIFYGIIVVALLAIFIRYRINAGHEAARRAGESLAAARTMLTELREMGVFSPNSNQMAAVRNQLIGDTRTALETVAAETDDRRLLAESQLARGDLYWQIANLPELPGAATQPTLRPDMAPADALKAAEDTYNQVLTDYPDQQPSVIGARFGLAAIAENRGQWDLASKQYQTLANDSKIPKAYQTQASARQKVLEEIQKPLFLATPTTQPASQASATLPPATQLGPTAPPTAATAPTTKAP